MQENDGKIPHKCVISGKSQLTNNTGKEKEEWREKKKREIEEWKMVVYTRTCCSYTNNVVWMHWNIYHKVLSFTSSHRHYWSFLSLLTSSLCHRVMIVLLLDSLLVLLFYFIFSYHFSTWFSLLEFVRTQNTYLFFPLASVHYVYQNNKHLVAFYVDLDY